MKTIIISCFMLLCTVAYSQQEPTTFTKCQLTVNDILLKQSFDIDEPVSEEARYVFFKIYEDLNLIYQNESNTQTLADYIVEFNETLQKAVEMNLNISMFQEDIDYVSNLTQ